MRVIKRTKRALGLTKKLGVKLQKRRGVRSKRKKMRVELNLFGIHQ